MSTFSHGMQKRVSVARALLTDPRVLLVDEATHDLDPEGSSMVRDLVRAALERGTAVLWATQRVEEIRGFADRVTLLERGRARFQGTVSELLTRAGTRRFVVVLGTNGGGRLNEAGELSAALGQAGRIAALEGDDGTHLLVLAEQASLGEALGALLGLRGDRARLPAGASGGGRRVPAARRRRRRGGMNAASLGVVRLAVGDDLGRVLPFSVLALGGGLVGFRVALRHERVRGTLGIY